MNRFFSLLDTASEMRDPPPMEAFVVSISLAAVSALAWLAWNEHAVYVKFAKMLIVLVGGAMMLGSTYNYGLVHGFSAGYGSEGDVSEAYEELLPSMMIPPELLMGGGLAAFLLILLLWFLPDLRRTPSSIEDEQKGSTDPE